MPFLAWAGSSGGGQQPYQFRPETYGATGNGIVCADVTTNGTATVTSPTIAAKGVAGQYIMIHGANGATSAPLLTRINSITGTGAVLAAAAGASVSNCPAVFGTDDTAAINSAVSAAGTYAIANNYFAEVLFGAKIYILGTGPTQTGNGSSVPTFNSQIPLPFPVATGTSPKLVLKLTGAGDSGYFQFWNALVPNMTGTCLVSMLTTGSSPDPTFGRQSVVGGPTGPAGFTGNPGWGANLKPVIQGISIWLPIWTNIYACDLRYVAGMRVLQSSAHIFAPPGGNASAVPPLLQTITAPALLSSASCGWATPVCGNNADNTMDDVISEGYEQGFLVFDHFEAGKLGAIYCDAAMKWDAGLGPNNNHGIFIHSMCAEQYNGGFTTNGGTTHVNINWDAECTGPTYDINATTDMHGVFRFRDVATARAPVIQGGSTALKVIWEEQVPGHWASPPAVPASGTAQSNTAFRDAWVAIHTGAGVTVSIINVDGTVTGLTVAASSTVPVFVPGGKNITLTYAGGTPTWDWWLN